MIISYHKKTFPILHYQNGEGKRDKGRDVQARTYANEMQIMVR